MGETLLKMWLNIWDFKKNVCPDNGQGNSKIYIFFILKINTLPHIWNANSQKIEDKSHWFWLRSDVYLCGYSPLVNIAWCRSKIRIKIIPKIYWPHTWDILSTTDASPISLYNGFFFGKQKYCGLAIECWWNIYRHIKKNHSTMVKISHSNWKVG